MNLRWNTSDFGGVKDLRVPPHRLWKPDVLMYNRYGTYAKFNKLFTYIVRDNFS